MPKYEIRFYRSPVDSPEEDELFHTEIGNSVAELATIADEVAQSENAVWKNWRGYSAMGRGENGDAYYFQVSFTDGKSLPLEETEALAAMLDIDSPHSRRLHAQKRKDRKMPAKKPRDPKAAVRKYYADKLTKKDFLEPLLEFLEENMPAALEDPESNEPKMREEDYGAPTLELDFGNEEYMLALSSDDADTLAYVRVREDLENEPEIFTQSWLENFINTDRLRDDLHSDVLDMNYERLRDENDDLDDDDEDKKTDEQLQEEAEKETDEQLRDPIEFMIGIYGDKEGMAQAMKLGGIDIDAAAEDAVKVDGAGHFLSGYDGEINDLPGGAVYWRTN